MKSIVRRTDILSGNFSRYHHLWVFHLVGIRGGSLHGPWSASLPTLVMLIGLLSFMILALCTVRSLYTSRKFQTYPTLHILVN